MLLVLLASALVGTAVLLLSKAFGASRVRVDRSLGLIEAYGFQQAEVVAEEAPRRSLVAALGGRFIGRLGEAPLEEQRKRLVAAGMYNVSAEQLLGLRIVAAVGVPLLLLQFALSGASPLLGVAFVVIGSMTGWTLPNTIVARRATDRLAHIDRQMPELVDLLVVGVESGMGFNGAIRVAVERLDGPLAAELRLMLQEQQLGLTMTDALRNVNDRVETPAVRSFTRTITQAEKLGISVGSMMRTLALEMRKRRRAQAEELAQKAPVKILFPLVFLIFPSLLIVLLTPAGLNIMDSFGQL